jgi:hypothetical protein
LRPDTGDVETHVVLFPGHFHRHRSA